MTNYIEIKGNAINIKGMVFGNLTTIGPTRKSKDGRIIWLCRCKCGNTAEVRASHLMSGHTQSCGCSSSRAAAAERFSTHGLGKTREYKSWAHIVQRCTNPNNPAFADYGGRGIAVYDEWRHNFLAFYNHASTLPHSGEKGYSIDRIDNNGHYEPSNVKWSTAKEQSRNTRANVMLIYNGKVQCAADWAKELGISPRTMHSRLHQGWSVERALTTLVQSSDVVLTHNDKTQCVADWARELDIPVHILYKRLYRGWDAEKTLTAPRRIQEEQARGRG